MNRFFYSRKWSLVVRIKYTVFKAIFDCRCTQNKVFCEMARDNVSIFFFPVRVVCVKIKNHFLDTLLEKKKKRKKNT